MARKGSTYSNIIHSLPAKQANFLKVCQEAGKEGVIYTDVMQATGMLSQSAATSRTHLLVKGKVFFNGAERDSSNGHPCEVVVAKEFATDRHRAITQVWLENRQSKTDLKQLKKDQLQQGLGRIIRLGEQVMDPGMPNCRNDIEMMVETAMFLRRTLR
jgi:hypothetical protein